MESFNFCLWIRGDKPGNCKVDIFCQVPREVELHKEKSKADRSSSKKGFLPTRQLSKSWFQLFPSQEATIKGMYHKHKSILGNLRATVKKIHKRDIPESVRGWHTADTQYIFAEQLNNLSLSPSNLFHLRRTSESRNGFHLCYLLRMRKSSEYYYIYFIDIWLALIYICPQILWVLPTSPPSLSLLYKLLMCMTAKI